MTYLEYDPSKRFSGKIEDVFRIKGHLAIMLTGIEGMPKVGMTVRIGDCVRTILELGRNSTDHKPISTRDCLTGRPVPPYGSILIEDMANTPDRGCWIEEHDDV